MISNIRDRVVSSMPDWLIRVLFELYLIARTGIVVLICWVVVYLLYGKVDDVNFARFLAITALFAAYRR